MNAQQELRSALSKNAALEAQVQTLERLNADAAARQRDMEAKILEMEANLAGKASELRAAQQAHAVTHQQKLAAEDELSRAKSRAQADAEAHVHEQSALRSRLDAEREAGRTHREAQARLRAEMESVGSR